MPEEEPRFKGKKRFIRPAASRQELPTAKMANWILGEPNYQSVKSLRKGTGLNDAFLRKNVGISISKQHDRKDRRVARKSERYVIGKSQKSLNRTMGMHSLGKKDSLARSIQPNSQLLVNNRSMESTNLRSTTDFMSYKESKTKMKKLQ